MAAWEDKLDDFTRGFLEAALWASSDVESGESFDSQGYSVSDFSPKCRAELIKDCKAFQKENRADLAEAGSDARNGGDFWLTRCRHGAGFWDRGYGDLGDRLTKAAHVYGNVDLYSHRGKIHC